MSSCNYGYEMHSTESCIVSGPSEWSNEFSSCKGKHQSPIDIDLLHVKKVNLPALILHNFDKPPNVTQIENNGHTGE
jgi:carbonic anhydrase